MKHFLKLRKMTTVNTIVGETTVTNAEIVRASGYGQYKIVVDCEILGEKKQVSIHSTDSQLFDKAYGEDNHSEIVINNAKYLIEEAINCAIELL